MPTYEVTSPDGRVFEVTAPDGASEAEVLSYAQRNYTMLPKNPGAGMASNGGAEWSGLDSFSNGVLMGLGDEIKAGAVAAKEALTGGLPFGNAYDQAITMYRGAKQDYQQQNPVLAPALEIGGGLASGVAGGGALKAVGLGLPAATSTTGRLAQSAATGAGFGGVYGFNEGEGGVGSRLEAAGKGAGLGGFVGGLAVPAAAGASKALNWVGQRIADTATGVTPAVRRMGKAVADDFGSLPEGVRQMRQTLTAHPDLSLVDAGGMNVQRLARGAAAVPGRATQLADEFVSGRAAGRGERLQEAVMQHLGDGNDYHAVRDALFKTRAQEAAPLYERAFAGGSIAPLETQFQNQFAQATAGAAQAQAEAQAAQRAPLLAQARKSTTSDVYSLNQVLAEERAATQRLSQAQEAAQAAEGQKSSILERLRAAQEDRTANAPGAVWSPRIQQFLDDPITKAGIRHGLEIQRLEATTAGKAFNPTEYAVIGTDASGDPIVGQVPNMRLLDAAKKGLDNILDGYRDPTTNRLVLDQRGRAIDQFRQAFINELDAINPDYAAARAAWAGPSKLMDAEELGRAFLRSDGEVTKKTLASLSPDEQTLFRLGAARQLRDMINTDTATAAGKFADKKAGLWAKLRQVFPDEPSFDAFRRDVGKELDMQRVEQLVSPRAGSHTAPLQQDIASLGFDPAPYVEAGRQAANGNPGAAAWRALMATWERLRRPNPEIAGQYGHALLNPDPAVNMSLLDSFLERPNIRVPAQAQGLLEQFLAEGGGVAAGYGAGGR